jgi:hypothetical protein
MDTAEKTHFRVLPSRRKGAREYSCTNFHQSFVGGCSEPPTGQSPGTSSLSFMHVEQCPKPKTVLR